MSSPRRRSRARARASSATASIRRRSVPHGRTSPPSITASRTPTQRLYRHVTTGRKAKFDDGHTEDHPIVKTSDPARVNNLVAWILALPVAAPVDVNAAQTLARQSKCMKCHAVDVKKEGPAWKDVATKYLDNPGAEDKLYKHVTTGRKAKFADGHEESHPIVKTRDPDRINNLVDWILSLK